MKRSLKIWKVGKIGVWKRKTKMNKTKRQNLPTWRKARYYVDRIISFSNGKTIVAKQKIKTKEWENVTKNKI